MNVIIKIFNAIFNFNNLSIKKPKKWIESVKIWNRIKHYFKQYNTLISKYSIELSLSMGLNKNKLDIFIIGG
jgi:hypothetical protein